MLPKMLEFVRLPLLTPRYLTDVVDSEASILTKSVMIISYSELSFKSVGRRNPSIVRPFCTSHFANCDQRQEMSIFELIPTSMAGLKKIYSRKIYPRMLCLRELQISNFSGAGEHAQ